MFIVALESLFLNYFILSTFFFGRDSDVALAQLGLYVDQTHLELAENHLPIPQAGVGGCHRTELA